MKLTKEKLQDKYKEEYAEMLKSIKDQSDYVDWVTESEPEEEIVYHEPHVNKLVKDDECDSETSMKGMTQEMYNSPSPTKRSTSSPNIGLSRSTPPPISKKKRSKDLLKTESAPIWCMDGSTGETVKVPLTYKDIWSLVKSYEEGVSALCPECEDAILELGTAIRRQRRRLSTARKMETLKNLELFQ